MLYVCLQVERVLEQCHFSTGMAVACLNAGHKSLTDFGAFFFIATMIVFAGGR